MRLSDWAFPVVSVICLAAVMGLGLWLIGAVGVRQIDETNQHLQRENQKLRDANDALMQVCEGKVNR